MTDDDKPPAKPIENIAEGLDALLTISGMLVGMRRSLIEGGFAPDIADQIVATSFVHGLNTNSG